MNSNIATNFELVKSRINQTSSSRDEMIRALSNLESAINNATEWQGVDATAHKSALLDFCQKLKNSAAWMEAAGNQAISHAERLYERAQSDRNARIFD